MTITLPCYCTREAVKSAIDIKLTTRIDQQVDRAIEAASRSIDDLTHRRFYTAIETKYWDWPNFSMAAPWRQWFEEVELADTSTAVLSSGGVVIAPVLGGVTQIFYEPVNFGPPFDYVELNRASTAAFGMGSTPQRDISLVGPFGFWVKTVSAGTLAAALTDTTGATVALSNGAAVGVGDDMSVDSEHMLVTDKGMLDTGLAQIGSGCSTASSNDVTLQVSSGAAFNRYETIALNSERMWIADIMGNYLTVKRAWDGTVLATHAAAEVWALRSATVVRGALGSTAATHLINAPVSVMAIPAPVNALSVAESVNTILQEVGGYSRTQSNGASAQSGIGASLDDMRAKVVAGYGRKVRQRTV